MKKKAIFLSLFMKISWNTGEISINEKKIIIFYTVNRAYEGVAYMAQQLVLRIDNFIPN